MPGESFLIDSLQRHCRAVLAAMSGEDAEAEVFRSNLGPDASKRLWLHYPTAEKRVSLYAGAAEEDWRAIGKAILCEEEDAPDSADHQPTYSEVVNQIASSTYRDITAAVGRELTASPSEQPAPSEGYAFSVILKMSGSRTASILFVASGELLKILDQTLQPKKPAAVAVIEDVSGDPRTMDLLLDVELPVCVSFGTTQLPLRDVIKLTSGSIVELSRAINEPVDLIVNNCVIARGEVVVVEGNYGVKIIQIVGRHERLRTLH